jgi:hypothetical protein
MYEFFLQLLCEHPLNRCAHQPSVPNLGGIDAPVLRNAGFL